MDGLRALRRFYEDELKPWDMAAGALLVTEAGAPFPIWTVALDLRGRSAGNKAMHELIGK